MKQGTFKSVQSIGLAAVLSLTLSGVVFADSQWDPNESSVADDASLLVQTASRVSPDTVDLNPNESSVMEEVIALGGERPSVNIAAMEYIPGSRTAPAADVFSYHLIKQNF